MAGWLVDRRPSASLVIAVIALFVALSGWGYAANGRSFVLGHGNKANSTTSLSAASKRGPALAITNTRGRPAASFRVNKGVSPFTVNSGTTVTNLNADRIDGLNGNELQKRVSGTCPVGSAVRIVNTEGGVACEPFWSLNGNAGTVPGTQFLGTTDAQPLVLKTNNAEALRVDPAGHVGIGTATPDNARLEVSSTTDLGVSVSSSSGAGLVAQGSVFGLEGGSGTGYGVAGVSGSGHGVEAVSASGVAIHASSDTNRAIEGFGRSGIGVIGDSPTRGVVGTLGGTSCAGVYAVGGCTGATVGYGVFGRSAPGSGVVGSTDTGNVFLGVTTASETHVARIDSTGKGFFNGGTQTGGADYAESIRATVPAKLEPGDVLAIDPQHGYSVHKARAPSSRLVAGVYSTRPAVLAVGTHGVHASLKGEVPVALLGVVPTKVSAENGAIHAGDLLVTARTAGYAMKASSVIVHGIAIFPTGAILGKALEPLKRGRGMIKILVMLR